MKGTRKVKGTRKARPQKKQGVKTKTLENEFRRVAKKYPELAGRYVVAKIEGQALRFSSGTLTETEECVVCGWDPVTGDRVCFRS